MRTLLLGVLFVLAFTSSSLADPDKPWAEGVSPDAQARALQIFQDANAQFLDSQYAPALARYREALAIWDHPAIHFNMAVCLINLEQPLSAFDHLEQAMKWGEHGLADGLFAQGVTYRKLLEDRLARLHIVGSTADAEILLDGKRVLVGPGEHRERLLPGNHVIVGRRAGFATTTRDVLLLPGRELTEAIALERIVQSTRYTQRWSTRTPWLVGAGGLGTGLAGAGMLLLSRSNFGTYERYVDANCKAGCPSGNVPQAITDIRERAVIERAVGGVLVGIGVAGLTTGIVMLVMNQPRKIEPLAFPGGGGAAVHFGF